MKYDHLIQSMEAGAEEKIRDIRERSAAEREEILGKVRIDVERLRMDFLADTRQKAAIEMNKQLYHAREEVNVKVASEREAAFNEVFLEARQRVSQIREMPDYKVCFTAMLDEVLRGLTGEDIVLHVDPRDLELCKNLVRDRGLNLEIHLDLSTAGGLNGSCSDGKILVRNTIDDRLEHAREIMKTEIFRALQGD